MVNILIRKVPDDVLATTDAKARRVGLSRFAYLWRAVERERTETANPVIVSDLACFAHLAADLDDPTVISAGWS